MTVLEEEIIVETTSAGVPHSVWRNGRRWTVGAEPIRWYERIAWWKTERRMPKGQGRIDKQVWRLQLRLGNNERSDLVTVDLERDFDGAQWRVRKA